MTGTQGDQRDPVWGGRRGASLERGAPGVTGQSHPRATGEGGSWAAEGAGQAEKTLVGGTKGRQGEPLCASRVAQTLPLSGRPRSSGKVKGSRPGAFYLFLGRSQFALSGFFRHPGAGTGKVGGPHHHNPSNHRAPSNHRELPPTTTRSGVSQKRRI